MMLLSAKEFPEDSGSDEEPDIVMEEEKQVVAAHVAILDKEFLESVKEEVKQENEVIFQEGSAEMNVEEVKVEKFEENNLVEEIAENEHSMTYK